MSSFSASLRRYWSKLGTPGQEVVILLLLAFLALVPRLYRINSAPAGLSADELFNTIDALRLGPGSWQVYFEGNNGREALFLYLMAFSLRLFGQSVWAARLPAIFLGTGAVLLAYGIGRNEFNRRVGFIASAFMAVSLWPVLQSRWGLRAVSLTFLSALAIYLYGLALRRQGQATVLWVLSGLTLGLTLYSYIPSRVFPLVIIGWMIWIALTQRDLFRRKWRGFLLSLLVALIAFAPLGLYMMQNPDKVNQRIRGIRTVFDKAQDGELEALFIPISATVRMLFIEGEKSPRYFLVGRPIFDPLAALLFIIGLISTLWQSFVKPKGQDKRAAYGLLILWAGLMLGPGAIAGLDTYTLRAAGAIVPIYLIAALGLETIYSWLKRRWPERDLLWRRGLAGLVVLGLALTFINTWHSYFDKWIHGANVRSVYHIALAEIGQYLNDNPPPEDTEIFITYDYVVDAAPQSFAYYSDSPATWFDFHNSFGWRPDQREIWYFEPNNKLLDPEALSRLAPAAEIEAVNFENGEVAFTLYRVDPANVNWEPQNSLDVIFADGPQLIGFDIPEEAFRGDDIPMTLHWQVPSGLQPLPNRLTYAVVVLEDESGNVWSKAEKLLGYPEAGWQSGDRFITLLDLKTQEGMPPGPVYLRFGLRDWTGPTYSVIGDIPERAGPFIMRSRPLENVAVSDDTPIFDNAVALQGHSFSTLLVAGLPIDIALDWLTLSRPESDYRLQLNLTQLGQEEPFLTQTFELWPDVYPPTQWQKGEQVTTFHRLQIPLDIPTDANALLGVRLLPPDQDVALPLTQGNETLAELTPVVRDHIFESPVISYPLEAHFGDDIRLLGYDLDASNNHANGELKLTLYWQAINTPPEGYTIFNHLVSADGQMQGQFDGPPVGDAWLTTTWLPGEIIVDERTVPIRPGATAGAHNLIIGLYNARNGERLPVYVDDLVQPDNQLLLTTIALDSE